MNDYRNDYNYTGQTDSDRDRYSYGQDNSAYSQQYSSYTQNARSEYSYQPKKKSTAGKKILTGIIAVLSVGAIATTSIVGYTLITGDRVISSGDSESESSKKTETVSAKAKSSVDRTNLPTIQQLSTPSDALTIPEIVDKVSPSVVGISCVLPNGMASQL